MIIKPAQHSLADSIKAIEQSDRFGFLVAPQSVFLGMNIAQSKLRGINILYWDVGGPTREYVKKRGPGNHYKGPVWTSRVDVWPVTDLNDLETAIASFEELLGPGIKKPKPWGHEGERRYHFPPELQPQRDDTTVVPHIIDIRVRSPEDTTKQLAEPEEREYMEMGELGEFKEVLLFPPPPHHKWHYGPHAQALIQAEIDAGRCKEY